MSDFVTLDLQLHQASLSTRKSPGKNRVCSLSFVQGTPSTQGSEHPEVRQKNMPAKRNLMKQRTTYEETLF